MSRKCYHCGEPLGPKDKVCPRCGADATVSRKPKTIYELRAYCAEKRVPLADIRFFIGEDYREPKAFGIYQDDEGQFVVYKNKADGTRAIRYRGPDEAHAVSEIFEKLNSEVELRRQKKSGGVTRSGGSRSKRKSGPFGSFLTFAGIATILIVASMIFFAFLAVRNTPRRGYYHYNNDDYYYYNNWYRYDDDEWVPAYDIDEELQEDFRDYRTDTYDGEEMFEDSEWYDYEYERSQSDDDDDDDYDWDDDDWDDWDTDDTDWDSDW